MNGYVVNRWQEWARTMRRRHARRDGRRLAGAMIVMRRGPIVTQTTIAGARTIAHTHLRLGVTLRLALAAPSRPATHLRQVGQVEGARQRPVQVVGALRGASDIAAALERSVLAPDVRRSPMFVDVRRLRLDTTTAIRRVERLHELIDRWRERPDRAAEAAALPARLRQRAQRHETPQPPPAARPLQIVRARQAHQSPEAGDTARHGTTTVRPEPRWPATQPAQPPISVDALTTQVIQQLDRRLLAYRERMGRV